MTTHITNITLLRRKFVKELVTSIILSPALSFQCGAVYHKIGTDFEYLGTLYSPSKRLQDVMHDPSYAYLCLEPKEAGVSFFEAYYTGLLQVVLDYEQSKDPDRNPEELLIYAANLADALTLRWINEAADIYSKFNKG